MKSKKVQRKKDNDVENHSPKPITRRPNTRASQAPELEDSPEKEVETSKPPALKKSTKEEFMITLESMVEEWKKTDGALKKTDLVEVVVDLRRDNAIFNRNMRILENQKKAACLNVTVLQKRIDEIAAHAEGMRKEDTQKILDLKKQLQEAKETWAAEKKALQQKLSSCIQAKKAMARAGGKTKVVDENKALVALLEMKAKTILWSMVKFIQSPEDETTAAKLLVKHGELPKMYIDSKEKRQELVETYQNRIKRAIFNRRNYTTSEAKKLYVKIWKAEKEPLSVSDLVMCLKRDFNSEEDMTKFKAYWEEYLPRQVGATEWGQNIRYYTTICDAVRKDTQHELPLITPDDEAFLVLSIENGLTRWKEEFETKQDNPIEAADPADETEKDKPNFNGLYTSTTTGQNHYGGWNEEGLERFNQLRDWNQKAREMETCAIVEQKCLEELRAKYRIQANNIEDHQKQLIRRKNAKKRGRQEEPLPPMRRVVRTLHHTIDSEDEDEEMASESD